MILTLLRLNDQRLMSFETSDVVLVNLANSMQRCICKQSFVIPIAGIRSYLERSSALFKLD